MHRKSEKKFTQLNFSTFARAVSQVGSTAAPQIHQVYSKHLYKTVFFFYSTMNGINMLQVCLLPVKIKLLLIQFNNSGSTDWFTRQT